MRLRLPYSTAILSEARLYAIESQSHTMDYQGWKDQHQKMERLTYGKFAQLWVYEFCRINRIRCEKDNSSPTEPDNKDLTICGHDMDVKTSTLPRLVGQISPGMYGKSGGFYCFILTDRQCSFVLPCGVISNDAYMRHSVEVQVGEMIPNTTIEQRFNSSRFLQQGAPVVPFFNFMADAKRNDIDKHLILPDPDADDDEFGDIPF